MAPIGSTVALSHADGVSDTARARELYKYYQPSAPVNAETCFPAPESPSTNTTQPLADDDPATAVKSDITSSKISSPDTALTAFCQLVTWRTGAQRAMIGLLDAETQYFVAESTRTVDLVDTAKHAPGDDIWMGCSSVSKAGKLCEKTISVAPTTEGYPCFIVNDLTKDERFNQLPFVTGAPSLRFYAGVPLITKRKIAIGSLFIVDDHVRDGLDKESIHFMGTMAKTIMKHMEMVREVEEHRRGMKMSRGLASFVEGRAELVEADVDAEEGEGTRVAGQFETDTGITRSKSKSSHSHSHRGSITSGTGSVSSVERKEREYATSLVSRTEEAIRDVHSTSDEPSTRPELNDSSQPNSFTSLGTTVTIASPRDNDTPGVTPATIGETTDETSQKILCSRAANLIRETFEVDGGCVFYDAQGGFASDPHGKPEYDTNQESNQDSMPGTQFNSADELHSSNESPPNEDITSAFAPQGNSPPGLGSASFSRSNTVSQQNVEILGFSTPGAASINGDELPGNQTFRPFDEKALHALLRRYPRGKLWTFDSDGAISSSSEEEPFRPFKDPMQRQEHSKRRKAKVTKAKSDAKFLSRHFPGVRQLLFVPLWDAGRSRWLSGCFAWSTELTRVLSRQSELSFLTAFGNSVMAEWSRMDTEIANQKKGDFIGSISHELRSPLHGILASAEFLGDEVQSTFEQSMVETISSCGRTLLDTINHVLDFSKINHFEKTWQKKGRRGNRPSGNTSVIKSNLPMINLYANIDISVVCEEVVEGVFAGHIFQNGTAANFDMVRDSRDKAGAQIRSPTIHEPLMGTSTLQQPEVVVIFDPDLHNYQFTTQPGAFRRVVMNLLGNALKYTSHGYVRIKLGCSPMEDFHDPETQEVIPRAMVTLTVTDTGKGISPDFLRSKLFTPFAQENSLSSGTGLGLAIVRSIVHILEGDITIESEVGKGTQVRVNLPLLRELPKNPDSASTSTPQSMNSLPRELDDSMAKLRIRAQGQRVSLHGFDVESSNPAVMKTARLLKLSVVNFVKEWYGLQVVPLGQKAGIIISNEATADTVSKLVHQARSTHGKRPSVVVLCSHTSRFNRMSSQPNIKSNIGYVVKPVGPLKLAKAIAQCLDGLGQTTPNLIDPPPPDSDLSNVFEEMSINPKRGEVLDNSRMAADSDNARKALESPTPNALTEKASEFPFPFPTPDDKTLKPLPKDTHSEFRPPSLRLSDTILITKSKPQDPTTPNLKVDTTPHPTFLLVDDNAINLTLLSTSISKRPHSALDTAMDGLAAVKKFSDREEGYDIVFMDISMPLLDGFGATKEIRAIEKHREAKMKEDKVEGKFVPALVIALTGLAASEDQARAAAVGVDLFLTKPVSFREVKRILDNWEANRGKET